MIVKSVHVHLGGNSSDLFIFESNTWKKLITV